MPEIPQVEQKLVEKELIANEQYQESEQTELEAVPVTANAELVEAEQVF